MSTEYATELYVHAIAIEREAAARYSQFAERMPQQGNEEVARLFRRLAAFEAKHLAALKQRTAGIDLPRLTSDYSWLDDTAPETMPLDVLFRRMTPQQALAIALQAEKRARAFFEHAGRTASDPAVRALAKEMAREEAEHIVLIERMLNRTSSGLASQARLVSDA
jgi:rubrerythrin